jgi:hypothetical protein
MRLAAIHLAIAITFITGCGERDEAPALATAPTTTRSETTTPAPATQPIYIDVDGVPQKFPPVRMQLAYDDLGITARLTTAAMPDDLDPGTGLRLDVPTGVRRVGDLDGLDCAITPEPADVETPRNAVMLADGARVLLPHSVAVTFRGAPPSMAVIIDGSFAEAGERPTDLHAELRVPVEVVGTPPGDADR